MLSLPNNYVTLQILTIIIDFKGCNYLFNIILILYIFSCAQEKLTEEISKWANPTEISTNDPLAKVLGWDHSGHVRCSGLGGLHSVAFQSTEKFSGTGRNLSNSNSVESSQLKEEVTSLKTKLAASEENVKTLQNIMLTYIQMKEGHIPKELGALFDTNVAVIIFILSVEPNNVTNTS